MLEFLKIGAKTPKIHNNFHLHIEYETSSTLLKSDEEERLVQFTKVPEDIEKLFPVINVGTLVTIVNQAVKVGWFEGDLYIEVHPPLETHQADDLLDIALDLIEQANAGVLPVLDGSELRRALVEKKGLPVKIYAQPNMQTNNSTDFN